MRLPGPIGIFLALVILCMSADVLPSQQSRAPLRTLVKAREVHDLPLAEASRAYPVHLRAVLTYFDPNRNNLPQLFVNDSTGSVYVEFREKIDLKLHPGDLLDVVGVSGAGNFAADVARPQVRVIGHSHLPNHAQPVNLRQITSGSVDCQWVQIEGVVHEAHFTQSNVTLDLATTAGAGGLLHATTRREPGVDYQALVDSLVVLRGNAGAIFNWKMQMIGGQLVFPSTRESMVVKATPGDPFKLPVTPFDQLVRFSPAMAVPHRVHVQGKVILQWPGRELCIEDAGDSLCMDTTQTNPVLQGSLVDAIGFPANSRYKLTLANAAYRVANSAHFSMAARPMRVQEALHGDFDGQLVHLEGKLIDKEHIGDDLRLMLYSSGARVPATLPINLVGKESSSWEEGSILRLTGLCIAQAAGDTWKLKNGAVRPGSVALLLRSSADVEVVQRPSWWTVQHALGILLVVALLSLAAIAWIIVLRHRVMQQTQALRASEERLRHLSEHDALTGLPNRNLLADRMNVALNRAERFHERLGLLMVDIDRFKQVNDTYGHNAGDMLLCEVASRIGGSVRKTDTVARVGGDEFIVLLPDLQDPQDAELVAAKILASISAPVDIGTTSITITASVGVSSYPGGGKEFEELLHSADAAMYFAKSCGRNALHVSAVAETREHPA